MSLHGRLGSGSVPLSLVQLGPIGDLAARAAAAERLGYRRFWFTEHYGGGRSGSPLVAAGIAAAATTRLRVGTAAVLLAHTSPLRVAADAALLAQQSGGRFDLGIASAVAPAIAASTCGHVERESCFEEAAGRLAGLVAGCHEEADLAGPPVEPSPLWICGESTRSAALAAGLGAGLLHGPAGSSTDEVLDRYRADFRPFPGSTARPRVGLLMRGLCAATDEDAAREWAACGMEAAGIAPDFLGAPDRCAEALACAAARTGADEIATAHIAGTVEVIDRSATLLASACGLTTRSSV